MLDFQQIELSDVNIGAILKNIDWYDPWIMILVAFHVTVTMTTYLSRNHNSFQVVLFLMLLLLVYFSEKINEIASENWRLFSKHQYFDSNGLFISLVFCIPILLNCMLMISNWLYQSRELMTQVKIAQLRSRNRTAQRLATSKDDVCRKENAENTVQRSHNKVE